MKDAYDKLYLNEKYNRIVNTSQFAWLMDRGLDGIKTAVDFGCGRGHIVRALQERGIKTVGVDFASSLAEGDWKGDSAFVHGDVRDADLGMEFDLVVCHDVLEHLVEADATVALSNLMKHTGRYLSLAIANHSDVWDGVELHLNNKPFDWWQELVKAECEVLESKSCLGGRLHLFWCKAKSD